MLGYVCKYTPVEIFEAMGTDIHRIEPDVTGFPQAEAWMHANMCSYSKAVLEDIAAKDYDGIILTTCCDSIRRLYDTLKHHYPHKFIYLMDAYEDVEQDIKKGTYNPLKKRYEEPGFEEECRQILTMMMSECCKEFEQLPILQNVDILRNILYSGVWCRYEIVREKREKDSVNEVTGNDL